MDKFRALQYFIAASERRSFSAAARHLEVSIPAVAKLITALERELGARLFDRTFRGLTLTDEGQRYLEDCRSLIDQLHAADEAIGGATSRPHGKVTIGTRESIAQHCILPALPRFRARYPDIQIDFRMVNKVSDTEASVSDVLILLGWPEHPDLVHRRIAQTRSLICAAPEYWASHGIPRRPKDLEQHGCLLIRNQEGIVIDVWRHERGTEKDSAKVNGWLVTSHSNVLFDAAIAGEGVARIPDLTILSHLRSGRLVPVLLDWETTDSPPINLLYRPSKGRAPRVRLLIEFVTELFRKLEAEREGDSVARPSAEKPYWYRRPYGRASAALSETK